MVAGVIGSVKEASERADYLKQQRVEAGLLVGGAVGAELVARHDGSHECVRCWWRFRSYVYGRFGVTIQLAC